MYTCMYIQLRVHVHVLDMCPTGQKRTFVNAKVKSTMTAKPLRALTYGCYDDAIVVEVAGRSHFIGECSFWSEKDDTLGKGFLVK